MKNVFREAVLSLKNNRHTNPKTIADFLKRLDETAGLVKEENLASHFCSFFVPFHKETQSVYLGHHIKADDWIPPGGHIKKGESPLQTVYREFIEELGHMLTDERVELFNISIKDLTANPRHNCQWHYDFWYAVHVPRLDFRFDRDEFYQAQWFTLPEAKSKTQLQLYSRIIQQLAFLK